MEFQRFTLNQRIQHALLFTSTLALIFTGLSVKYPDSWGIWTYKNAYTMGTVLLIHKMAGIVLIAAVVLNILYVFIDWGHWDIVPRRKDFSDFAQMLRFFFRKSEERPKFGRYTYYQKFDYWAVVFGCALLIPTGIVLWFKSGAASLLPASYIAAARAIHSGEAVLAILAIFIFHFYNSHYNPDDFPISWAWWHGKISEEKMKKEHPLEHGEIVKKGV